MTIKPKTIPALALSGVVLLCSAGSAVASGGLPIGDSELIWKKEVASHYGSGTFVGYCGNRFDSSKALVVAHRSTGKKGGLRCGQKVAFRAPGSSKVFKATVVDRMGNAPSPRRWDLSLKLARNLGVAAKGVAPVHAAVLPAGSR